MNIQDIKLNQISQIYVGKDRNCRCGCAGEYVSTSFMKDPRNDVDDKLAESRLKRAKKLALNTTSVVDYEDTYINVSYGKDRAITIYLDEVK